jgi:DUF1365 family protein
MPTSMGYEQNPLSVYYGYDEQGGVAQCIAEVGDKSHTLLWHLLFSLQTSEYEVHMVDKT